VLDIATFTVLFLNFVHGLVFRAEYISSPALVSLTQWQGEEAPTQLNVTKSLNHSNQYSGKQVEVVSAECDKNIT